MNAHQRRVRKRDHRFFVKMLGEIADSIETKQETPDQVAKNIREIQKAFREDTHE